MVSLKSFKLINDNEIDDLDDTHHHHHHQAHPHQALSHHLHPLNQIHTHDESHQEMQQATQQVQKLPVTSSSSSANDSDRIRILQDGTFGRIENVINQQQQQQRTIVISSSSNGTNCHDDDDNETIIIAKSKDHKSHNNSLLSADHSALAPPLAPLALQLVRENNNNTIPAIATIKASDNQRQRQQRTKSHAKLKPEQAHRQAGKMGAETRGAQSPAAVAANGTQVNEIAITLPILPTKTTTTTTDQDDAENHKATSANIDSQQQQSLIGNTPTSSSSSSSSTLSSSSSISIVVVRHNDRLLSGGNNNNNSSIASTGAQETNANATMTTSTVQVASNGHQVEAASAAADDTGADDDTLSSIAHSSSQSVNSNEPIKLNGGGGGGDDDDIAGGRGVSNGQTYKSNLLAFPGAGDKNSGGGKQRLPPSSDTEESRLSVTTESEHFEIVWSNLSYRIEPKWYKKFNVIDRIFTHFAGTGHTVDQHSSATSTASSSANMTDDHAPGGGGGCESNASSNSSSGLDSIRQKTAAAAAAAAPSSLEPIEIFTNLNGTIRSGQMTAVLGPSGAGKTTLLNCLTGKLRNGVSGHINLKGANGKHLKMCTIPQKDHLLEQLTVEENLWFASKIKNPEYGFDHAKNIERVIDLLGLKRCRSAKIKKISGGQHKRVSIAQELLSNPDILVLDEPTSGLDSLTCFKTISMLRDLVELSANNDFMKPMAIIVTIHQPQPKVFNLFHHVYILANGGRVIYEGAPQDSLETITNVTCLQPIDSSKSTSLTPGAVDPASFLIEIASEEYGLDVITTLSDYQRNTFYEANNYREAKRQSEHMRKQHERQQNSGRSKKSFHCKSATSNSNYHNCHGHNHNQTTHQGQENHGFSSESGQDDDVNHRHHHHNQFVPPGYVATNNDSNSQQHQQHLGSSKLEISCDNSNAFEPANEVVRKCKRRKRSSVYSLQSGGGAFNNSSKQQQQQQKSSHHKINFASSSDQNLYLSEQLLYTRVPNHKGRFWSHTATLTHRTLLTIRRDPLLMTSRVLFHLMIPILMGHVYGKATGAANACPHYEPEIDITQIPSLVENKRIEFMLEELHMSIENVSMFFIIMYAFAAAVLALNALSFPLNMQVLLKETRNGWYSMSSYVLAKTLADLPLELTMPCMTMLLVYPLTGQPSSYLQWRMLTICLIMTLCSLIAQTQALILGALVMNSVQTAVFVSQASQLPWVILAGFTIRIKRLSEPLKLISLTSFYRLGCEAITLTRYGFGICPCNPQEITGQPVRLVGIPDQLRTVAQYWLDSVEASKANNDTVSEGIDEETATTTMTSLMTTTTTMMPTTTATSGNTGGVPKTDIFQHLANQLSYANSYGVNITSCDDVAPDRIRAINLGDNWLVARIWHLLIMLVIMKIILYYAVRFSIGIRL